MGVKLAAWASGDDSGSEVKALLDEAEEAARKGKEAFTGFWKSLSRAQRDILGARMDRYKKLAAEADSAASDEIDWGADQDALDRAEAEAQAAIAEPDKRE